MRKALLLAAAILGLAAGPALAQETNRNVLSIQPLSMFFQVYNLELERVFRPHLSGALGFTYWDFDEDDEGTELTYLSVDVVKLRYYPSATAPNGFSFGGVAGVTHLSEEDLGVGTDESVTAPSIGILLEYSRLLGRTRRFYLGGGIGAKMLFIDEDDFVEATARYPTARLAIGFAF